MDNLFGLDDDSHDILAHLDDEVVVDRRLWPKDLAVLADTAILELKAAGVVDAQAITLMEKLLVAVSLRCGGRGFYLPKGDRLRKGIRDRRIFHAFDGTTHGEGGVKALAEQFRLSEAKIYEVLREQRQIEMNKIQRGLDV